MSDRLHLIPNASAGGSARIAFPDDDIAIFVDALSEGPVPPLSSAPDIRTWLTQRLDFWCGLPHTPDREHYLAPMDKFLASFGRCDQYDDIVVWTSEALSEGLFACWAVRALQSRGANILPLKLAQPDPPRGEKYPGYLGGMAPDNLQQTVARTWTESELETARKVWRHFTASSPGPLIEVLQTLPERGFLSGIPSIRGRFPSATNGLDVWEQALLERISSYDESSAHTLGHVMGDAVEYNDHIGDGLLFGRLLELSDPELPRPLLERTGPGTEIRNTEFEMTDLGEAVLAGDENRVEVLGLDRWIGGVHLSSNDDELWWRIADTIQPERPTD